MLTFEFTNVTGEMIEAEMLTSGMAGKTVRFLYSSDWEGMTKNAVFTDGYITRVVPNVEDIAVIPAAVLKNPGRKLIVGILENRRMVLW